MTAVMVHVPEGFTGPVWLAHYVRSAQSLARQASNAPSLPLDGEDIFGAPAKAYATGSTPGHGAS